VFKLKIKIKVGDKEYFSYHEGAITQLLKLAKEALGEAQTEYAIVFRNE
jgi:hypothetical protein